MPAARWIGAVDRRSAHLYYLQVHLNLKDAAVALPDFNCHLAPLPALKLVTYQVAKGSHCLGTSFLEGLELSAHIVGDEEAIATIVEMIDRHAAMNGAQIFSLRYGFLPKQA